MIKTECGILTETDVTWLSLWSSYTHTQTHPHTNTHKHTYVNSNYWYQTARRREQAEGRNMLQITWTTVLQWANINWFRVRYSNWERQVLGNVRWRSNEGRLAMVVVFAKAINITQTEFVFVALVIQHAMRICQIIFRALSGSTALSVLCPALQHFPCSVRLYSTFRVLSGFTALSHIVSQTVRF